jgi:ubiquitin-like 1-activating enzyme E1 B
VFDADVRNLLSMADMWRTRAPPVPLPFGAIRAGTFEIPDRLAKHLVALAVGYSATAKSGKGSNQTEAALSNTNGKSKVDAAKLRDQRVLGLEETMDLFVSSYVIISAYTHTSPYAFSRTNRLAARLREGELTIAFDKDDLDALDFVTASANLRSFAYGIQLKSKWEVKGCYYHSSICACADDLSEMAGNIIPAIATTNAIIAGLIVLQALHLLRRQSSVAGFGLLRNVYAQVKPVQPLLAIYPSAPDPKCGVCRDTFAVLRCDPTRASLGDVVRAALGDGNSSGAGGTGDREVAVFEGTRLLAEPDWDDNLDRPLADLGIERGKFLTIVDEEGDWGTLALAIAGLP